MDKFYMIMTVLIVFFSLANTWLNLKGLLARNSKLENLSKRKLLNSVIIRGLYTIWFFVILCFYLSNFKRNPENEYEYFVVCGTIWSAVSVVEYFIDFLIPCKELIRKSRM